MARRVEEECFDFGSEGADQMIPKPWPRKLKDDKARKVYGEANPECEWCRAYSHVKNEDSSLNFERDLHTLMYTSCITSSAS